MHTKLIHQSSDGQRTFVVVLETGDEVASQIKAFADREKLKAAQLTAIGAFSDAVLGYFDWEQKQYRDRKGKLSGSPHDPFQVKQSSLGHGSG